MKNLRKHYVKDYNQNFQTPFKLQEIKGQLTFNENDEAKSKKLSFILMNFVFATFVAFTSITNSFVSLFKQLRLIGTIYQDQVSYGEVLVYGVIGVISLIYSVYLLVLYLKSKRRSFY